MSKVPISATIITLNEESNLERALKSLQWVDEVLIVDSGSRDGTLDIAKRYGAKTLTHAWVNYGNQKNFAQSQASHDWILNIDADEEISPELASEIQTLFKGPPSAGQPVAYHMPRRTYYLGKWIRHGGWYPNRLVRLANRRHASWSEPLLHEKCMVQGQVGTLNGDLCHYPFASIEEQMTTNLRYSKMGYLELKKRGAHRSFWKLLFKPIGKFLETYLLKRGFLDGMAGFIISVNAAHSVFLKYAYFYEMRNRS